MKRSTFRLPFDRLWVLSVLFFIPHVRLCAQISPGSPGPNSAGYQDLSLVDSALTDPAVSFRVYYPATTSGLNAPLVSGVYPTICFGHGFNIAYLSYTELNEHLASWGYLVLVPDVQNGFSVDHAEFCRQLRACALWIRSEGSNPASFFFQHVDPVQVGVMGHSMGGGASFLSADEFPEALAACGLAAAETNPSAIASFAGWNKPFQYISGSADNTVPENTNAQPMYNATTSDKHWVSLIGGGHCKFTDATTLCDLVSAAGTMSRSDQKYFARKNATAFFNYYLKSEAFAATYLCGDSALADVANGNTLIQHNLTICLSDVIDADQTQAMVLFPNPADSKFTATEAISEILDFHGHSLVRFDPPVRKGTEMDCQNLPNGLYVVVSSGGNHTILLKN
jgi:dienelactone hydrolase